MKKSELKKQLTELQATNTHLKDALIQERIKNHSLGNAREDAANLFIEPDCTNEDITAMDEREKLFKEAKHIFKETDFLNVDPFGDEKEKFGSNNIIRCLLDIQEREMSEVQEHITDIFSAFREMRVYLDEILTGDDMAAEEKRMKENSIFFSTPSDKEKREAFHQIDEHLYTEDSNIRIDFLIKEIIAGNIKHIKWVK